MYPDRALEDCGDGWVCGSLFLAGSELERRQSRRTTHGRRESVGRRRRHAHRRDGRAGRSAEQHSVSDHRAAAGDAGAASRCGCPEARRAAGRQEGGQADDDRHRGPCPGRPSAARFLRLREAAPGGRQACGCCTASARARTGDPAEGRSASAPAYRGWSTSVVRSACAAVVVDERDGQRAAASAVGLVSRRRRRSAGRRADDGRAARVDRRAGGGCDARRGEAHVAARIHGLRVEPDEVEQGGAGNTRCVGRRRRCGRRGDARCRAREPHALARCARRGRRGRDRRRGHARSRSG